VTQRGHGQGPGEGAVLRCEARHAGVSQTRLQPGAAAERRAQEFQGGGSGGIITQIIGALAGEAYIRAMADDLPPGAAPGKPLTPAARRALEEAAARRQAIPKPDGEVGGPAGLEPTRYGDWERKGLAVDF